LFLSLVDVLAAAPLAASLVSITCRRLARRAAFCVACLVHSSMSCPRCRLLDPVLTPANHDRCRSRSHH
jgi:hypothetical protein